MKLLHSESTKREAVESLSTLERIANKLRTEKSEHAVSVNALSAELARNEAERARNEAETRALRERFLAMNNELPAAVEQLQSPSGSSTLRRRSTSPALRRISAPPLVTETVIDTAETELDARLQNHLDETQRQLAELQVQQESAVSSPVTSAFSGRRSLRGGAAAAGMTTASVQTRTATDLRRSSLAENRNRSRIDEEKSMAGTSVYESDDSHSGLSRQCGRGMIVSSQQYIPIRHEDLVQTWKAHLGAMRRELMADIPGSSLNSTANLAERAQQLRFASSTSMNTAATTSNFVADDLFRRSLDESERRRLQTEDENRRLLTVMNQVSAELRANDAHSRPSTAARSPSPGSPFPRSPSLRSPSPRWNDEKAEKNDGEGHAPEKQE